MVFIKKEPLDIKIKNAKEELYSRKEHERIQRMTKTLSHSEWTLEDFSRNLNLVNEGWDPRWDFDFSMFTNEELKIAFSKREQNGWKAKSN